MTLLLAVLLLFAGAPVPVLAARRSRRLAAWLAGAPFVGALALIATQVPSLQKGELPRVHIAWLPRFGLDLAFRLDGLALLFALLVLSIGLLIVLYASYYLSKEDPLGRFLAYLLLFAGAMTGLVLSDNVLLMVVFWELTSVSSFLLIGYWSDQREARRAAEVALSVTAAGGLALLGGVLLLGSIVGSFELTAVLAAGHTLQAHPHFTPALLLILVGAFSKSAQFPLHFWLPRAMAAPTPVSAYLHSATMVKAGVFLLARLHPALAGGELWVGLVSLIGLATMLFGAYIAFLQTDLKGLLAYSTISHLGLIVALLGFSTPRASIAAVFHILNHATFKASLFMAAGIIDHETGTRDIRQLNGLFRHMPRTGALAIIAAAAMAGVPLLNGFLSKEMFFMATLMPELPGGGFYLAPVAAALAGAFAITYSLRFVHDVFFRGDGTGLPKQPHEPPVWMRLPVGLLAVFCLYIGIFPNAIAQPLVTLAASAVLGETPLPPFSIALWHGVTVPLVMTLAAMLLGLALYLLLPKLGILQRAAGRYSLARAFDELIERLVVTATQVTAMLANGSLQRYASLLVGTALLLGWLTFAGERVQLPTLGSLAGMDLASFALWAVAILASLAVVGLHQRRYVAIVLLSTVGSVVALAFVRFAAPDLALTQLLIEIVSILVMLLALHHLPQRVTDKPVLSRRIVHGLLASGAGIGMAALTWALLCRHPETVSQFFLDKSLSEGGGRNVVNVILVDFRAFDTMGEISVLSIAGIGVAVLLDGLDPRSVQSSVPRAQDHSPLLLRTVTRAILPLALVMGAFLFLRGHNLPGGGFISALVTTIALVLQYLASGSEWTHRRLPRDVRPLVSAGLAIALAGGLAPLVFRAPLFTMAFTHVELPWVGDLELASSLVFDLGVFLTVIGATTLILTRLGELSRGNPTLHAAYEKEPDPWLP